MNLLAWLSRLHLRDSHWLGHNKDLKMKIDIVHGIVVLTAEGDDMFLHRREEDEYAKEVWLAPNDLSSNWEEVEHIEADNEISALEIFEVNDNHE